MKVLVNGTEFEVNIDDVKAQLEEGIENPQIEIKNEGVILRTTDDESAFIDNMKRDARVEGLEIGIKNFRNESGLAFEGKNINSLVDAVKAKATLDANVDPDKKVIELEKDIKTLQGTIGSITSERDTALNGLNTYKKTQTIESTLMGLIPDNVAIPKGDMLTIVKSKFNIDLNENNQVTFSDGNGIMKNGTTLNPLTPKEVITGFFDENKSYLKPTSGGAGGGDSSGAGGKKSVDVFNTEMSEKGYPIGSIEYVKQMEIEMKAGTLDV